MHKGHAFRLNPGPDLCSLPVDSGQKIRADTYKYHITEFIPKTQRSTRRRIVQLPSCNVGWDPPQVQ